jgi:hypothetical protein
VIQRFLYTVLLLGLVSCNMLTPKADPEAVARVGDVFLYREELIDLVPPGTSSQDSLMIVRSYIDRWATQKLLSNAAALNINSDEQLVFDKLVEQYKVDLYTKAYLEDIVMREVDTVVSQNELVAYYNENKENFKTTGTLLRLRYIHLPKDHPKFETIKSKFYDKKKTDAKFWETYQMHFKSSALNDTVWVEMNQVYRKLPFITPDNRDTYISSGKSFQYTDSIHAYIVKINTVLDKNQISPFEYIKPTLKELLLNKRKLELIKKFEKEITNDAIKNKKYEIYK